MKQFYTYLHSRPNGEPFYVGKGHKGRAQPTAGRNQHHKNIVAKYGAENIEVMGFFAESETQAFIDEAILIRFFGRLNNGTGVLVNMTDGGEGPTGYKHTVAACVKMSAAWADEKCRNKHDMARAKQLPVTSETKEKIGKTIEALWKDSNYRNKMCEKKQSMQYKHTAEACEKMSAANKAHWETTAYREKIIAARKVTWSDPIYHAKMCAIRKATHPSNKRLKRNKV